MRILILSAFERELESILEQIPNLQEAMIAKRRCKIAKLHTHELAFSFTGLGTTAAASNTTAFCEIYDPDLIVLSGVAGGLEPNQQIGDLVVANKIIDADLYQLETMLRGSPFEQCLTDPHTSLATSREYSVRPHFLEIISLFKIDRLKQGGIVTSNLFPAPKEFFNEIKKMGCSAIEMESIGVFNAAQYYDIPVIVVRAISNLLDNSGDDMGTPSDALSICSARIAIFLKNLLSNISALEEHTIKNRNKKIAALIQKHKLCQHPEGGWFHQTFKSENLVVGYDEGLKLYKNESRAAGTSIIYLLEAGDYSAWHTVQSDETWIFQDGDPLLLRIIDKNTAKLQEIILGLTSGKLQYTVKAGHIFSAEPLGRYSLTACVVTPGFDFKDFKLIIKNLFLENFPQYAILSRLAREEYVTNDIDETKKLRTFDQIFFNKEQKTNLTPVNAESQSLFHSKL